MWWHECMFRHVCLWCTITRRTCWHVMTRWGPCAVHIRQGFMGFLHFRKCKKHVFGGTASTRFLHLFLNQTVQKTCFWHVPSFWCVSHLPIAFPCHSYGDERMSGWYVIIRCLATGRWHVMTGWQVMSGWRVMTGRFHMTGSFFVLGVGGRARHNASCMVPYAR